MQPPAAVIRRILREPSSLTGADLPWIRSMNLGGYVYQRLPSDHLLRPTLRSDVLQLSTRHALIRRELRALLQLWQDAGLPVVLLKGFALAEFEYDLPGERFYGDVDLLLPNDPDLISRAVHLAIAQGWRSDGQHARPELWTHECAHLYSPGGHVKLDVHRFVPAWSGGPQSRVQDITRQLWENAVATNWEGLRVTLPSPVDRAVITLALGRCWGGDSGGLKPADPVDLRLLRERHQLTPQALMRRAQELEASHTWAAFEALCSPEHPDLSQALQGKLPSLLEAVRQDRGSQGLLRWNMRLKRLPHLAIWMWRVLPDVLATGLAWRRREAPLKALRPWSRPAKGRLDLTTQAEIISAVRWWTRLLYPRQAREGVCVPRAYATFRALRRYGHPAIFVSGVARSPAGITGHAWVEDDRGVMESYGEPLVRLRFTESFRFPQVAED